MFVGAAVHDEFIPTSHRKFGNLKTTLRSAQVATVNMLIWHLPDLPPRSSQHWHSPVSTTQYVADTTLRHYYYYLG